MRTFNLRTLLGLGSLLAACNPETDLQKEQTSAAGTEGEDGQLSGASSNARSGQLVDPPTGMADVATNLASVVVRFPEPVVAAADGASVLLQPAGPGEPVALQLGAEMDCSAKCYTFVPGAQLAPTTAYTVRVPADGLQFLDGKPVPAGDAGAFTTAPTSDAFAPRIEAFTLQIAEGCATIHVAADEQVRAEIVLSAGGGAATLSSPGVGLVSDFSQRLPRLAGDPHASAVAWVSDRSGNRGTSAPLSFDWPAPDPRVVIIEVLANPAGSETTQEFVELFNAGEEAVELAGWTLDDKTGKDVLPEAMLMPGAFALVVAEAYNPADGKDPAPAQGTLLVRVSGRIGSDGLSNSGEAVHLVSPQGQIASQYGGWVDVSATAWSGRSTKRISPDACDAIDAWSKTPSPPTPGW
jgi:hypothetical protein